MKHLIDVNLLIAGIVKQHPNHAKAAGWLDAADIVLCPIVELGFLRIGTNVKSSIGLNMTQARKALEDFATDSSAERIEDDLPALDSHPRSFDQVTDHYLADLAAKHGLKLATLDGKLKHPSVELVS